MNLMRKQNINLILFLRTGLQSTVGLRTSRLTGIFSYYFYYYYSILNQKNLPEKQFGKIFIYENFIRA